MEGGPFATPALSDLVLSRMPNPLRGLCAVTYRCFPPYGLILPLLQYASPRGSHALHDSPLPSIPRTMLRHLQPWPNNWWEVT